MTTIKLGPPKFLLLLTFFFISLQGFAQIPQAPSGGTPPAANPTSGPTISPTVVSPNSGAKVNDTRQSNKQVTKKAVDTKNSASSSKQNETPGDSAKPLTPEQIELAALRSRIFGSNLFNNSSFTLTSENQIATPQNYFVGPGDELNISVYNWAMIPDVTVTVDRDGYINIPFKAVGKVYVNGKTIAEVRKILIGKYAKTIPTLMNGQTNNKSVLSVSLGEIRTVTVYVTGEAINPGSYEMSSLATAFNALYQAGGPNEIGTFREVKIVRDNQVVSTFDIYDYLLNSTLKGNLSLRDNDNIQIGYYRIRVDITGKVKRQGLFEMKPGEKLNDLIRFAGGFEDGAFKARVKIIRFTDRERKIIDVPSEDFDNFELKSGDEVSVEPILNRFENIVSIQGSVFRPGDYALESSGTLLGLLKNAQGLTEDAFSGRVTVNRTREDMSVEALTINLKDMINKVIPDLELQRLDEVVIPSRFQMVEQASVKITGEVNNQEAQENGITIPYLANMTLEDLLVRADGLRESADAGTITIIRRKKDVNAKAADSQISEVFTIAVDRDLSMGKNESGFILWPYDEVIVRKASNYQAQRYVSIVGEVISEGTYPIINKNDKISDIIKRAGGLTDLAYPQGATLSRITVRKETIPTPPSTTLEALATEVESAATTQADTQTTKEENIGINLPKILESYGKGEYSNEDLVLQENDVIRIPKRLETVQVSGETLYPTTVKYNHGMSFLDYISQSGGFTRKSLRKSSFVKYPNGSIDRTRRFLVFNVYPKIEPGSEIVVPLKSGGELTPQQAIQTGISISSSLFALITSVLLFRSLK